MTRRELETIRTAMVFMTVTNRFIDVSEVSNIRSTYERKKACVERFHRFLAAEGLRPDLTVMEVTTDLCVRYLIKQAKARSKDAANRDRTVLLKLWNWANEVWPEMQYNPMLPVKRWAHTEKVQYTPPTKDVLKVLAVADRKQKLFLDCYLKTGARRSEIMRWNWLEDVNFEKKLIRLGSKKSRDGSMKYRWLDMHPDLEEGLRWKWENRTFKHSPYVWVDDQPGPHYGKPYKARRRFLPGLCKRAKVRPFTFHGLRRYVASVLADTHQVSAKRIQLILGHENLQTTERYIQNLGIDLKDTIGKL